MSSTTVPGRSLAGFSMGERQGDADSGVGLTLVGQLDAEGALLLADELDDLFHAGVRRVTLDFERVTFISSSGVGSLIASISEYREENGDIVLAHLPTGLRSVFEMLGLLDYITLS